MRFDTLKEYPMTGDLYVVVSQDDNSGQVTYAYDRQIRFKLVTDGARVHLYSDEEGIDMFSKVTNIKDANGVDAFPEREYRFNSVAPVVNVYGYVEETMYIMSGQGK